MIDKKIIFFYKQFFTRELHSYKQIWLFQNINMWPSGICSLKTTNGGFNSST